jgi:hypothetical protein
VALTAAIWERCVRVGQASPARTKPAACGTSYGCCAAGRSNGGPEVRFGVHVRNDNRERTPPLVRLKAVCGLGDDGELCVTVMLPQED